MWRVHNRERLLTPTKEKLTYLRLLREDITQRCKESDFKLYGYCVMGSHVHQRGESGDNHKPLSNHMRRVHSRFAQGYNRRHNRCGSLINDRPKTKPIQNAVYAVRVALYCDCNPVKAGMIPTPDHFSFRKFSTCRFYAWGEKNEFTDMLTLPDWYLDLGPTPASRQREYRSMLDKYLVKIEVKADPTDCRGLYIGAEGWASESQKRARELTTEAVELAGGRDSDQDTS
jgi:REP element-mobilizing transposase RayT